ncbi:MAG: iron-containing alcohol dehydrogenase [Acidobacteria bacterium]|nr:iron-containing alcohol dehydrogenase [Acidobacteriota bacterium]
MQPFEFQSRTQVVFGEGALQRLGELARWLGFRRSLLVADQGLVAAGHVEQATKLLTSAGIETVRFHDFLQSPDTGMVEGGRDLAERHSVDSIVALGGGSSLDCAKGINFLLTNGGKMEDYLGYGKAAKPMLPMVGIPTTAGTGSEAQSYALISDVRTHAKMACGDPQAAFRIAILDPRLTVSQPFEVRAASGFDAISHAVETYVTTKRNAVSECFSREAWRLLEPNYQRVLEHPDDLAAQGAMQLGALFAGIAIENSMLGAAHACANPLTAHYGIVHAVAIALLLPHVVQWNGVVAGHRYNELMRISPGQPAGVEALADRLQQLAAAGRLPVRLSEAGVSRSDLLRLAEEAAQQWTGRFNPRPFDIDGALEIYECAF